MKTSAHHLASVGLALPVGLLAHSVTDDGMAALAAGLGCALGVWLTPDLDLGENRRLTPWSLFWLPYAKLIPHRSFWSHFPVVGTVVRAVYLLGALALLAWVLKLPWLAVFVPWWEVAWALAGLAVSDAAHWVMDSV